MMDHIDRQHKDQFYKAILSLETPEECEIFFQDICTIKELKDLTSRLEVARMLRDGRVFSEISKVTGASSATIGRVNRCLQYGDGGYETILDRIESSK